MCLSTVQQTAEAWRPVFYILAAVYAFSTVFYGLFGSGEMQPWAEPPLLDDKFTPNKGYGTQQAENRD